MADKHGGHSLRSLVPADYLKVIGDAEPPITRHTMDQGQYDGDEALPQ